MHFTKMHGLGNDYLYVYGEIPPNVSELVRRLSERHFGAGSDGMIFISPSDKADFNMRIFNADGSEAMMCGNGIRCVGKYVYDKHYTDKTQITVDTLSGVKALTLFPVSGKVKTVSVNMGKSYISDDMTINVEQNTITCTPVSMGNPHAVIFVDDLQTTPVAQLGNMIEHNKAFPNGVNAEFVEIISENNLKMRVWERGSGITMACGTGACACAAAAVKKGICSFNNDIAVKLDGGTLHIRIDEDYTVTMTGPAETVYEGDTEL